MNHQDEIRELTARMAEQRSQLQRQFAPRVAVAMSDVGTQVPQAMQPFQPRSLLMKLILSNPQVLSQLVTLVLTSTLGLRGAPWLLRGFRLWMSLRKPR